MMVFLQNLERVFTAAGLAAITAVAVGVFHGLIFWYVPYGRGPSRPE